MHGFVVVVVVEVGKQRCMRGSHSHLVPSRCDTSEKMISKIEQKHSLKQKKGGLPCYNISPRWRENPPCPHHGCGLGEGYRTLTRMHPCPWRTWVYKPVTFPNNRSLESRDCIEKCN